MVTKSQRERRMMRNEAKTQAQRAVAVSLDKLTLAWLKEHAEVYRTRAGYWKVRMLLRCENGYHRPTYTIRGATNRGSAIDGLWVHLKPRKVKAAAHAECRAGEIVALWWLSERPDPETAAGIMAEIRSAL